MKKSKSLIGILVVALAISGAYLFSKRPTPRAQAFEFTAVLPLTGPLADLGANERIGMTMALADLDAAGKRQISFRFEDSQSRGPTAVTAVQKAWNIDGQRLFVVATTGPVLATVPFFKDQTADRILIAQTMFPRVTADLPFAFRLFASSTQEAALLAQHAINNNLKRVAILHINNEWGAESTKIFAQHLRAHGADTTIVETFGFADKDFRTVLAKIAATRPDALLIYSYPDFFPPIMDQYKSLGLTFPLLVNTDFAVSNLQNRVPVDVLDRTVFPAPRYFYEAETEEIRTFNQRVTASGHTPNFDIATFYDMTMILNKAAELSENGTPAAFNRGLQAALPYHGVTGNFSWAEDRDVHVNYTLARWRQGKLELIK